MRAEVFDEIGRIMGEARAAYTGSAVTEEDSSTALRWCSFAREYLLDHWNRFERFGVASRDDLIAIVVTVHWTRGDESVPPWLRGADTETFNTSVNIEATVLNDRR